jgi:hypothetical protein
MLDRRPATCAADMEARKNAFCIFIPQVGYNLRPPSADRFEDVPKGAFL